MTILYPVPNNDFGRLIERVFNEVRMPLRSSKYSNHIYSNFVHVYCLIYKERLNVSYRRFKQIAEDMQLNRLLGLKKMPHFTTIQKFLQRVDKQLFRRMVRACHKLMHLVKLECSIDATGLSLTNPSHYYRKRIDGICVKNYVKTSLNVENRHKLVLDIETHCTNSHDTNDFIPLLEQLEHVTLVLADKAYDSAKNIKYVTQQLKADCHIPVREWKQGRLGYGHKPHIHGKHRLRMLKHFNKQKYGMRSIVESINSALKRTMGSYVCSHRPDNQQKQVVLKALAYNIEIMAARSLVKFKALILWFA